VYFSCDRIGRSSNFDVSDSGFNVHVQFGVVTGFNVLSYLILSRQSQTSSAFCTDESLHASQSSRHIDFLQRGETLRQQQRPVDGSHAQFLELCGGPRDHQQCLSGLALSRIVGQTDSGSVVAIDNVVNIRWRAVKRDIVAGFHSYKRRGDKLIYGLIGRQDIVNASEFNVQKRCRLRGLGVVEGLQVKIRWTGSLCVGGLEDEGRKERPH
jgi:hypothetical protein